MNITKKQWIILGVAFSLLIVWIIMMNRSRKTQQAKKDNPDNDNSLLEEKEEKESNYSLENCAMNCRDVFYQAKNSCEDKYRKRQISFAQYKACIVTAGQQYEACLKECERSQKVTAKD